MIFLLFLATIAQAAPGDAISAFKDSLTNSAECQFSPPPKAFPRTRSYVVGVEEDAESLTIAGADPADGKILWEDEFPAPELLNPVKTSFKCKGNLLSVVSQMPFSSVESRAEYRWNGKTLQRVSSKNADPSDDALSEARARIYSGTYSGECALTGDVLYPDHQIFDIATLLRKGYAAIRKRSKDPALLAERTRSLLSTAACFADTQTGGPSDPPRDRLQGWIASLRLGQTNPVVSENLLVPILNDYGFFLQQSRKHPEAIAVFRQVLRLQPGREMAYLNLADSEWETGDRKNAAEDYATYVSKMTARKWTSKIPARAKERRSPR